PHFPRSLPDSFGQSRPEDTDRVLDHPITPGDGIRLSRLRGRSLGLPHEVEPPLCGRVGPVGGQHRWRWVRVN
ncbi:hypothetical protein JXA88_14890, partial [Candidatus Fermentibacteria bacterium]|nr:hypothetical protein [Candidatus Fermentibacteria bacterium]